MFILRTHKEDSPEDIAMCLKCIRPECTNCIRWRNGYEYGASSKQKYKITDRRTGNVVVSGSSIECSEFLGIRLTSFERNYYNGGNQKYIYEREKR